MIFLRYIDSFLNDGILFIAWFFPMYLFVRIFLLKNRKKSTLADSVCMTREMVMAGLCIYLIMLFTQTFVENVGSDVIELVPFKVIIIQFIGIWTEPDGLRGFIFNVGGNIGVFIPLGIMISYLFGYDGKQTGLCGMLLSVFIEATQLPLERATDIDDVILNTSGALVGWLIYQTIKKRAVCKR